MYQRFSRLSLVAAVTLAASANAAYAIDIKTSNEDLKIRWDNTIKYSAAFRVQSRDAVLVQDPNVDDGDRNFSRGLVSNRVDWLSEFDAGTKNAGVRVSAAAWYDTVYNRSNDNDSPGTSSAFSVPYNQFTKDTRDRMGRGTQLLDAFAYLKGNVGTMAGTVRLGQHNLVYGQTLFFGANGIANAQGPIDLIKLLSVPSSEFKEILLPVPQVSATLQLLPNVTIGGYYQFDWRGTLIPPVGSYLSNADFVGEGAERFLVGGGAALFRGPDMRPKDSGQGGLNLTYTPKGTALEFGLHAARYHDKTPNAYIKPGAGFNPATGQVGQLIHVYAENISTYGLSLSTNVGAANVAGEISVRRNTPLVSPAQVMVTGLENNSDNPLYAVGNSFHANLSTIYVLHPGGLWQGGSFLGEIAFNRRTSLTRNAQALDPNSTRDATAMRFIFTPSYFQVIEGLDLNVPIGVGYNISGRSSTVDQFNGGVYHGGDVSVGLTGTYEQVWQMGLTYNHYLGKAGGVLTLTNPPIHSYLQGLKDRDFVSFNIKRTF
jgi:hypothetical protein